MDNFKSKPWMKTLLVVGACFVVGLLGTRLFTSSWRPVKVLEMTVLLFGTSSIFEKIPKPKNALAKFIIVVIIVFFVGLLGTYIVSDLWLPLKVFEFVVVSAIGLKLFGLAESVKNLVVSTILKFCVLFLMSIVVISILGMKQDLTRMASLCTFVSFLGLLTQLEKMKKSEQVQITDSRGVFPKF